MTNNVRTQSITGGQIGQINDRLATKLRKSGLSSANVQEVLKMPGNAAVNEMFGVFRRHVAQQNGIIICWGVLVDRDRTPQAVVNCKNSNRYIDEDVLKTMPKGYGSKVDVFFVPTKRDIPAEEVPKFLAQYGLVSDPRAQAAVNESNPTFARKYQNGTQWDDCYLAFNFDDCQRIYCGHVIDGWANCWYLSGVPADSCE